MRRGIVYVDNNYAEFGPIPENRDNIRIMYEGRTVWGKSYDLLKDYLGYDYLNGCYVLGPDINVEHFPQAREMFPYNLDNHNYNTKFVEHLFRGKQQIKHNVDFKFIDEFPYTFGLEFETAGGLIPQHRLYELGLIPLRDGSISGVEFSTVVLKGNSGLNLLKQQVEELDKHTIFDKDCSLHIHLGNFELTEDVLLTVNNLFCSSDIGQFLPPYTFSTHMYKTNKEKNYCEFNNKYMSFQDMYLDLVGRNFYGDFTQPHPKDLHGTRKWNIRSRYRAVNFINALCYAGPKTIEYRMLRPTYNFSKMLGWLFVYGAFIKYAEQNKGKGKTFYRSRVSTENVIRSVYSAELANILSKFLKLSYQVVNLQTTYNDNYGMRVDLEDKVITYESIGHYFY